MDEERNNNDYEEEHRKLVQEAIDAFLDYQQSQIEHLAKMNNELLITLFVITLINVGATLVRLVYSL